MSFTFTFDPLAVGADEWPPPKEAAKCCTSKRDALGRLPLGFCSSTCMRRRAIWRAHVRQLRRAGRGRSQRLQAA